MAPLIIGFGHKARHGKDEAIKTILVECAGKTDARKYGFGDALKREVTDSARVNGGMEGLIAHMRLGPLPSWVTLDPAPDMSDPLCPYGKHRTVLQWWGTEFRRAHDPDYWVKKTMARIAKENPAIALICDVRFPNEVEGIRAAGGYVVRVDRTGFVSDVPQHYSEKALDHFTNMDWDAVISAPDGKVEVLREAATNTFNFLSEVHQTSHA